MAIPDGRTGPFVYVPYPLIDRATADRIVKDIDQLYRVLDNKFPDHSEVIIPLLAAAMPLVTAHHTGVRLS